ncbi:FG-GAP-like repeat-containing protein [Saprospiraceae bacterium]|nr:FG-GAP-like repeat-containing protein [Saprospiraceae bacterium]
MKKNYVFLPLLFSFFFQTIQAQISFTNSNNILSNANFHSGVAIAVTDMNNDGKDDIVRMNQGYDLTIEYQNQTDEIFTTFNVGNIDNGSQWSMCVADVNNDGFNEVLAGGAYDEVKLAMASGDGASYTTTYLPGPGMFVQGSNFADINNDGFLDVFACHDDAESRIWGNDGMGNLLPQDDWIDMNYDPNSDNSGNYGSVWTDFDNDGDIDLYIAKCRQGVTDPTDPRRINQLYVNDGNGNYSEMGEEYGLAIGWQSWTADFQDVNNDGWMDCFVTNHDHESQLMINDGTGHFIEATNTGIEVDGLPIQGVMRDFDNDGYVDIIVSGSTQHLFKNNGDLTFTEEIGLFDGNEMESYALGDLNNDGFVDVYAGYASIYTSPSSIDDVVWLNDGNSNNHLSVQLQGVISNRNAVGARIEVYGPWGVQVRDVRSGESYGIMNSMIQYFGLGTASEIDSVVVNWPSGIKQTETGVNVNSTLKLIEGGCIADAPILDVIGSTLFCTGESITINAPAGYASYEWSTGATTPSINVTTQGNFSVTVTDVSGCFGFSSNITTIVDPVLTPEIIAEGDVIFCDGETVVLSEIATPDAISYTWSDNQTGSSITVSQSGLYTVEVEGPCNSFVSQEIEVDVLPIPGDPTAVGDTVALGGMAELTAVGANLAWYDQEVGGTPIGYGNNFTTDIIDESQLFYVEDRNVTDGIAGEVGMTDHNGTDYSGNLNSNNQLIFDALLPFTLDSVKVYTDFPGERKILLLDANGSELNSAVIDVPDGETMVYVGMEIPEGIDLVMTTDAATNQVSLSVNGPRLKRSSQGVNYPYDYQDYASLKSSNFGEGWYYYFYDWQISTPSIVCPGERVPVEVWLDTDVVATIDFGKSDDVKVFPNPTDGNIAVQLNFDIQNFAQLLVTDMIGQTVLENRAFNKMIELNLKNLPKGVYLLQVIHGGNVYSGKVVLQ